MTSKSSIVFMLSFLILSSGCEPDEKARCYPTRITKKISLGTSTTDIIADYKYENDTLDRIVRSDYQTHHFEYNDAGYIVKISRKNRETFQNHESRLIYDGALTVKSDEFLVMLDRFTQEDKEVTQTGYREFVYDGMKVIEERLFEENDSLGKMELSVVKEYEYDLSGNIITYVALSQPLNDTLEAFSFTYDSYLNPYSSLNLIFEGESYINNVTQKTDLLTGDVYDYQIQYDHTGYPDQIIIKQESYMLEIINFEYICR
ncbi:MAG TPA: hypothetical protein VJ951_04085 [Bacteroidales bacterium]|nr:hypothetical protein [Bacteroidales bacterium]